MKFNCLDFFKERKTDIIHVFALQGKRCEFVVAKKDIDAIVQSTNEGHFFFKDGSRRHFAKDEFEKVVEELGNEFIEVIYQKRCFDATNIKYRALIRKDFIVGYDKNEITVCAKHLLNDNERFVIPE